MALLLVKTDCGLVEGLPAGNQAVSVFKGIPFAAPPEGEWRWRAPRPAEPWDGVLKAYKFPKICWQARFPSEGGGLAGKEFYVLEPERSEDCLYLNIWTPAKTADEKLPVAIYIHGGGFNTGFSYLNCYDGEAFAKRGIVLVTIQYRLGVFGALSHPLLSEESQGRGSGNYGMLDQVEALKWVKRNIAAFGGDPECITVFGQSGGGRSTCTMSVTPLTKGLFKRAIMQSGGGMCSPEPPWLRDPKEYEKMGERFFNFLGIKTLEEARAIPAEKLLEETLRFSETVKAEGLMMSFPFNIAYDGYVFPDLPSAMIQDGKHHDIDYMLGCTADERTELLAQDVAWCENEIRLGRKPSYMYYFTYVPPGAEDVGAHHSVEHHYVFQTLLRSNRPYTGWDWELSNELCDYWSNFIKYGDPNGTVSDGAHRKWTPFTAESPKVFEIGRERRMIDVPQKPGLDELKANALKRK